jgi:predicted nucleotidyltransferase
MEAVLIETLRKSLAPWTDTIKAAFVYGSVARGTDVAESDIDLMVIGDELNYSDLYTTLQNAECAIGRKISPIFLSVKDWQRKASEKGPFIRRVKALPKNFVIGSELDLDP